MVVYYDSRNGEIYVSTMDTNILLERVEIELNEGESVQEKLDEILKGKV